MLGRQGAQQTFGRDGRPAGGYAEPVEAARETGEDLIDQGPEGAQGVVGGDALLAGEVANDPGLPEVVTAN